MHLFLRLTSYARDGCASHGTWNQFERMFSAMLELATFHVLCRCDNHHNTETTWLSETKPFERLSFWGVALGYRSKTNSRLGARAMHGGESARSKPIDHVGMNACLLGRPKTGCRKSFISGRKTMLNRPGASSNAAHYS